MNKFINISFLLGLIIFTGCLKRPDSQTNSIRPIPSNNLVVREAYKYLGKPYKYGATGPNRFDCSGFVYTVYKNLGITIPRTSREQSQIQGKKLSKNELRAGDLVFFDTSLKGHVNHVGIYLGHGKFIHASSGKAFSVTISDINAWYRDKFRWGKRIY
ncbi:NLP/P60 family protein [hydrothermal vent metagenome]|uniref:NLP/P60 family protein n=1 Tax=hydrothermal vent metagenome TaxID=652676 RepID=A0A1W1CVT7_9ZZZZ